MKKSIFFPLVILLLIVINFFSCNVNDVKTVVDGIWIIDSINYNGRDIKQCLSVNRIVIKIENKSCKVPLVFTDDYCLFKNIDNKLEGDCVFNQLSQKEYSLSLSNVTTIFEGRYDMYFINDSKKKILRSKISNGSLSIVMGKFLFDYDAHKNIIVNISKESW